MGDLQYLFQVKRGDGFLYYRLQEAVEKELKPIAIFTEYTDDDVRVLQPDIDYCRLRVDVIQRAGCSAFFRVNLLLFALQTIGKPKIVIGRCIKSGCVASVCLSDVHLRDCFCQKDMSKWW